MDLGLFLSLVGPIPGSVAAITGVLVLMTLQPPFIQNASVSKHGKVLCLTLFVSSNLPNCHVTTVRVKGMRLLKISSHMDVLLWKGQIPFERFSKSADIDVLLPPSCAPCSMSFSLLPDSDTPPSVELTLGWRWRFFKRRISSHIAL